ncbi:MAG: LLM class flavin-dependent oxidoreductase [Candidatus Rokubacteria bacterium]|nr:LLM class flavin-dependent oxidoreductase [Candidatus Rokubacteria bacterium]MBI3827467.1 LLM class flavin-dependent oxidoreductase [Candidatus Rokubacteria bacterium]
MSTWLAIQTRRLKLGCAFNILPMWHPVRLAEDYAVADIVTEGRVIMGVGRGYHTREVEFFGAPMLDNEANRELFEEQMEVFLKCFGEESFSHHGKHYDIPPPVPYRGYELREVTCVPRPIHRPVEIWQPIASGKTLDYIASRGVKGMITSTASGSWTRSSTRIAMRPRGPAGGSPSARTSAGAWASTSPTPRPRRCAAWSRRTTSGTSGSRRSASCATRTRTAGRGARRARRRARPRWPRAWRRRRGSAGPPRTPSRSSGSSRRAIRASTR